MKKTIPILLAASIAASVAPAAQATDAPKNTTIKQSDRSSVVVKATAASTQELYAMVNKPTTPYQILENIKFVVDHDLLLREDFYTDENFNHFFGAVKISQTRHSRTRMSGGVDGFEAAIDPPIKVGDTNLVMPSLSMTFGREIKPDGIVTAYIELYATHHHFENVDFDGVTRLFGSDWTYGQQPYSPHPQPPAIYVRYKNGGMKFGPSKRLSELGFHLTAKDIK